MALETPKVFPSSAESSLHLIGNANSSLFANPFKCPLEVASRVLADAPYTHYGLGKEGCDTLALGKRELDHLLQLLEVEVLHPPALLLRGQINALRTHRAVPVTRVSPEATIGVGQHHVMNPTTGCHRVLPGAVGGQAHGVWGHAVVRVAEREDVVV